MAILFTKEEAVKDLPFIEDKALYRGVDLALWLYLDKHWSLRRAVDKAAEKHAVEPKIAIERLLLQVVPEEVVWARMILVTKEDAVKDLPFIEDKAVYKGVDLALWLYLDKHWSLRRAVDKAAEKHSVKPKIAIERLLRQVVPEELIWARINPVNSRKPQPGSKQAAIRSQNNASSG